jgi:uncharacterized protein
MTERQRLSRRSFLKLMGYAALDGLILSVGGGVYGTQVEPGWLDLVSLTLKLPRLGKAFDGLRMVQLSDIHMGGWMTRERFDHIVDVTLAEKPDVVVITGDFILGSTLIKDFTEIIADLRATLPRLAESVQTLAVMGNHDHRIFPQALTVRKMVQACGIVDLTNRVESLVRGGERLHFAGVDDILEGRPDMLYVLEQLPEDGAAIALVHEPDFADAMSVTGRFDLQLSGHSHGGQIALPLIGPIVLPPMGQKYIAGQYQIGEMIQYTTRGVGMTEPPVRINCRPEITALTLRAG